MEIVEKQGFKIYSNENKKERELVDHIEIDNELQMRQLKRAKNLIYSIEKKDIVEYYTIAQDQLEEYYQLIIDEQLKEFKSSESRTKYKTKLLKK